MLLNSAVSFPEGAGSEIQPRLPRNAGSCRAVAQQSTIRRPRQFLRKALSYGRFFLTYIDLVSTTPLEARCYAEEPTLSTRILGPCRKKFPSPDTSATRIPRSDGGSRRADQSPEPPASYPPRHTTHDAHAEPQGAYRGARQWQGHPPGGRRTARSRGTLPACHTMPARLKQQGPGRCRHRALFTCHSGTMLFSVALRTAGYHRARRDSGLVAGAR
jgi:hypothetical protein